MKTQEATTTTAATKSTRKPKVSKKNTVKLYMGTGLLRCPVCGAAMHVKYSSASGYRTDKSRAAKYACTNKPKCPAKRLLITETNDKLWGALLELLVRPERIYELVTPEPKNDPDVIKKELARTEREQKLLKEKQARLLDLYLEGNVPQASYVVKTAQLEKEEETLHRREPHSSKGSTRRERRPG